MAETQTQTNVNVSDIPDWQRPYWALLMNSAAGLTFDPNFIREQMANFSGTPGSFNPVTGIPIGGTGNTGNTGTGNQTVTGGSPNITGSPNTPSGGFDPQAIAALQSILSGQTMSGKSGMAAADSEGGGIGALSGSLLPGASRAVTLAGVGSQLGSVPTPPSGGVNPNPVVIGPGAGGTTYPPYTQGPTQNPSGGGSGPATGAIPGLGTTGWAGGNVNTLTPTQIAANNAAAGILGGLAGQSDAMGSSSGYNPDQYAPDSIAALIAARLGGKPAHTVNEGPNAPPPQNLIDMGIPGSGNMLNAGLVAQMLRDPGQAPFAQGRLNDELSYLRHESPAYQSFQGPPRTSWASAGDDSVRAMLARGIGGMAKGGMVRYDVGGSVAQLENTDPMFRDTGASNYERAPWTPQPFGGGQQMWGNAYPQGQLRSAQSVEEGGGTSGGVGGGGSTLPLPGTSSAPSTGTPNSSYPYRAYTPYSGQRILDWTGQQGARQISPYTQQAEAGLGGGIASYFDQNGQINAGRDANGNATSNFGIANDQLDWAGRQVGNAIEGYQGWNQFAQGIQHGYNPNTALGADPQLMSAGQISIDPLTQYQMQGPDTVTASEVNPNAMWTDPGQASSYMNPYEQNVIEAQRNRAMDDFAEQRGARNSSAVAAGAFGGSRAAVQEGVAQRALNRNLQNIDAMGLNRAYQSGMQQFNTDRGTALGAGQFNAGQNIQAQLANQGARQQAASTNLGAALQTQDLATNAGLAAQQSNQGANVTQFGQLMNAQQQQAQLRAQAQQAAGQMNLTQAQIQGQMGMGALGGLTNSATALGGIASTRADLPRLAQQLELQRLQAQQGAGASQDQRAQNSLNIGYQDFQNQQNWPFQLANFYMGQMQGVPVGVNQEQIQYQNYSPASQWGGLAAAGIGAVGSYYGNRQGQR